MDEFFLSGESFSLEDNEAEGEGPEFIVLKPATGWTDQDDGILERGLDLAGIGDPAERMAAALSVDTLGIICLAPLVKSVDGGLEQIRKFFERVKGGIGK